MIDVLSVPNPTHLFKLGSLENLDSNKKIVEIVVPNWPVKLMTDGCATNVCASRNISQQLGLLSPSVRCSSHTADGTIKRISTSKTRNVSQITEFLPTFCTVMRFFLAKQRKSSIIKWRAASVECERSPPDDLFLYSYSILVNCLLTSCASHVFYLWRYDISRLEMREKVIFYVS